MVTYIGNSESLKNTAQTWFSRSPFVGSIRPVESYVSATADFLKALIRQAAGVDIPFSGYAGLMQLWYACTGRNYNEEQFKARVVEHRTRSMILQTIYFQFFPETITDERAIEKTELTPIFLTNAIPTISGAASRTVSFKLRFTREKWTANNRLHFSDWDKYNVDVATAVQAIRSFLYPVSLIADSIGIVPQAAQLTLPGTKIGINTDSIIGLVVSYKVAYVSFFSDGQPRIADVDISFVEFPMLNNLKGNITRENFNRVLEIFSSRMSRLIRPVGVGAGIDQGSGSVGSSAVGVSVKTDVSDGGTMPPVPPPRMQKLSEVKLSEVRRSP